MADLDLDAITAREQEARPGPWTMRDDLDGQGYPGHLWIVENDEDKVAEEFGVAVSIGTEEDAEFIAHARADVPALIAEVRRLRERLAAAELVCVAYGSMGVIVSTDRQKATYELWSAWTKIAQLGALDDRELLPDERIAELARRRDAKRAVALARLAERGTL